MSQQLSPTTGRRYGIERVCGAWEVPRSTFYARRRRLQPSTMPAPTARRRGPRPRVCDEELLAYIRADLLRTPFTGEGYRKVWARLRVSDRLKTPKSELQAAA